LPRRTPGAVFLFRGITMPNILTLQTVLDATRESKEMLEAIAAGMLDDDDAELTQALIWEEAAALRDLEMNIQHQLDIEATHRTDIRTLSESRRKNHVS
jgi:hypothetical protein